jgi:hypothetical protein
MKSLNSTDKLWTSLSAKDADTAEYQAACCLNARINFEERVVRAPEVVIDNQTVPVEFLRKILERSEDAKANVGHAESIKAEPTQK